MHLAWHLQLQWYQRGSQPCNSSTLIVDCASPIVGGIGQCKPALALTPIALRAQAPVDPVGEFSCVGVDVALHVHAGSAAALAPAVADAGLGDVWGPAGAVEGAGHLRPPAASMGAEAERLVVYLGDTQARLSRGSGALRCPAALGIAGRAALGPGQLLSNRRLACAALVLVPDGWICVRHQSGLERPAGATGQA